MDFFLLLNYFTMKHGIRLLIMTIIVFIVLIMCGCQEQSECDTCVETFEALVPVTQGNGVVVSTWVPYVNLYYDLCPGDSIMNYAEQYAQGFDGTEAYDLQWTGKQCN